MIANAPPRVAIALDPGEQPRWIADLLSDLVASPDARLVYVATVAQAKAHARNGAAPRDH